MSVLCMLTAPEKKTLISLSLYFKCCSLLMWSKNYFFSTERQRPQPLAI